MPRISHRNAQHQQALTTHNPLTDQPLSRCTAANLNQLGFCDALVPADSPVSMCGRHLRLAYGYCLAKIDRATDDQIATIRDLVPRLDNQRLTDRMRKARSVVYYALVGAYIKIGTTIHLDQRMRDLGANLIAVEPGSYDLERDRHNQFAILRIPSTEYFRPGPDLVTHVAALVDRYVGP